MLKRYCTCSSAGEQFCLPHRLRPYLSKLQIGHQLWSRSPHAALVAIRQLLSSLNIGATHEFTWKMFRAGHATSLAAEGKSLGQILSAGEWRSTAVLSYVDEDTVDASEFLNLVLEDSDID